MSEHMGTDPRERKAAIVLRTQGEQRELNELYGRLDKLFGTGVRYDNVGRIYIRTYRNVSREGFDLNSNVQVYPKIPQASILSPRSEYQPIKTPIISQPADVESAIRMARHIIDNSTGKEHRQADAVYQRAESTLQRFKDEFGDLTDDELKELQVDTGNFIGEEGLNLIGVKDTHKRRMITTLFAASGGRDRLDRRNPQAMIRKLQASQNAAMARLSSLGITKTEFEKDLVALELERTTSSVIFQTIVNYIRPEGMPASVLFRKANIPDRKSQETRIGAMLGTMVHQLENFIHLNGYKSIGREVAEILKEIQSYVVSGREDVIMQDGLFQKAWMLLANELQRGKEAMEVK